ncbi:class I SAM-dependent methyltransferase [Siccirubricoccus sp. KC 17139]|uniref:Class I SAM-dependent methyltransferase n=1 Tax=Siccirubricoccus soli TaxID=2899147 RepID=A0ABT1D4B1_9PROT|nr:class I SAM-dependent methyltransferase [Siccirubricoccus soli]MCO6416758.1 class I SAM-dependent methyltransferase [Siccirubricoccus soli]MCP2682893.1 class I SAM-dependent methyltransferase [Siccirubricoccus soli]
MTHLSAIALDPADRTVRTVKQVLTEAMQAEIDRSQGIYAIEGMSGGRYRHFINHLVRALPQPRYLEVGSWMGSTLCAAIHGNAVQALAIDDWSQFGGPKEAFLANVQAHLTPEAQVGFLEGDFRQVPFATLAAQAPPYGIYLFDGPHEEADQYDGLARALPALAELFVFICDDWNWAQVRRGTWRAIADSGLETLFAAEIRTSLDNSHGTPGGKESDWHNGYFISVLRKPPAFALPG